MLRTCSGPAEGAEVLTVLRLDPFALGQAVALEGFLCAREWQLCLQIPLLISGQGSGISRLVGHWWAATRGFWDVFSGSLSGSRGQGRSCHTLSCLRRKAGEHHCRGLRHHGMAPAGTGGAFSPLQTYLSACSGFSKQPVGFPNPHPAGDALAPS